MTENEAIKVINDKYETFFALSTTNVFDIAMATAIKALEEIKQYRAIGLTPELIEAMQGHNVALINDLGEYQAIGTIEEFKTLKEKSVAKKPIEKVLPYSEEFGFNSEWKCPTCGAYVGYFSEGMSEPEQMEYCNECGQHIAKDWTET